MHLSYLLQRVPLGLRDREPASGVQAGLGDSRHVRQDEGASLLGMVVEVPGNVGYTLLLWLLQSVPVVNHGGT